MKYKREIVVFVSLAFMVCMQLLTFPHSIEPAKIIPRKQTIFTAILTKNRLGYVRMQAETLHMGEDKDYFSFVIFDDGSDDETLDSIREIYNHVGPVVDVSVLSDKTKANVRANSITMEIFKIFLEREEEWIIILDSDLVLQPNWMKKVQTSVMQATEKTLFTLYNSCMHKSIWCNLHFCKKRDVGSAGILFSRHAIQMIVDTFNENAMEDFDWQYSRLMARRGFSIYAFSPSLVEHVGLYGSNYPATLREVSEDFDVFNLPSHLQKQLVENLAQRDNCKRDKLNILENVNWW